MNKVILMGRLTRDPEVRYSQGATATAVARYTLAVDRRFRREGEATCDFINCVAFGKLAEVAEKYYRQGTKLVITGRIQTGSYTNKDGLKVHTTDIVIEESEFAESKNNTSNNNSSVTQNSNNSYSKTTDNGNFDAPPDLSSSAGMSDGFMNIPDGIDEELPFR